MTRSATVTIKLSERQVEQVMAYVREQVAAYREPAHVDDQREAPPYVHDLLDAYLTGTTLNFQRHPVPADVQSRLTSAVVDRQLGVTPDRGPVDALRQALAEAGAGYCRLLHSYHKWEDCSAEVCVKRRELSGYQPDVPAGVGG